MKQKTPEILKQLIKDNNLTASKLATRTDLNRSTVGRIIKGAVASESTLQKLSNYFNLPIEYLEFGNKEYKQHESNTTHFKEPQTPYYSNNNGNEFTRIDDNNYIMKMPLIEIPAQAGFCESYGQVDYITGIDNFHSIIVSEPHKGKYLAFRVKGDSMDCGTSQAITTGSIVTVRELKRELWRDKLKYKERPYWIVCHRDNSYPVLKQITKHDTTKGIITCHSTNTSPEFQDFDLHLDEVTALFYVVDVSRPINKFNQNFDY